MLRAFVGLAVPEEIARALGPVMAGLPTGRAVDPANLHITLAFLGQQQVPVIEDLHLELGRIEAQGFSLALCGLGLFGGERARSVHAAVVPDPALGHLRRKVQTAAREVGIALPRERFVPHVTLARFLGTRDPEALGRLGRYVAGHAGFFAGPVAITGFTLFRSTLHPGGAVHDALATYPLRA